MNRLLATAAIFVILYHAIASYCPIKIWLGLPVTHCS